MTTTNAGLRSLAAAAALGMTVAGTAAAAPIKIEASIATKAQSKLEFADGSNRYLIALQREGKASGTGPLAGATMLEWGVHDVAPATGAHGNGYLVLTRANGDVAYLKYQFRAIPMAGPDGRPRPLINGSWEVVGATGELSGLRGGGTLHVKPVSPNERHWVLEGDLAQAAR